MDQNFAKTGMARTATLTLKSGTALAAPRSSDAYGPRCYSIGHNHFLASYLLKVENLHPSHEFGSLVGVTSLEFYQGLSRQKTIESMHELYNRAAFIFNCGVKCLTL